MRAISHVDFPHPRALHDLSRRAMAVVRRERLKGNNRLVGDDNSDGRTLRDDCRTTRISPRANPRPDTGAVPGLRSNVGASVSLVVSDRHRSTAKRRVARCVRARNIDHVNPSGATTRALRAQLDVQHRWTRFRPGLVNHPVGIGVAAAGTKNRLVAGHRHNSAHWRRIASIGGFGGDRHRHEFVIW